MIKIQDKVKYLREKSDRGEISMQATPLNANSEVARNANATNNIFHDEVISRFDDVERKQKYHEVRLKKSEVGTFSYYFSADIAADSQ